MRNLTLKERAIVVGALLTFLLGAGHRYHKANSAAAQAVASPQTRDAKG